MEEEEVNEEEGKEGHWNQLEFLCVDYTGSVLPAYPQCRHRATRTQREKFMLTRVMTRVSLVVKQTTRDPKKREFEGSASSATSLVL
jgi:hypothetical protein